MDALLTTFVAAVLAEFGDKTQLLAIALAARYAKPGQVLAGIAIAALANSLIAAAGGVLINGVITLRATSLLVALALIFAAVNGFTRVKQPDMGATWRTPAVVTTAACFFLLEFGDKTQFVTGAFAAQFDALLLAAFGAAAGVIVANIPAVLLAERYFVLVPSKPVRIAIGCVFLVVGFVVAINALRLT